MEAIRAGGKPPGEHGGQGGHGSGDQKSGGH
jgi:hypothetical protein